MASENNSLDLESTSLNTEVTPTSGLSSNPVSEFEDSKRSLMQRSLASAQDLLQTNTPHSNSQQTYYKVSLGQPVNIPPQSIKPESISSPDYISPEEVDEELSSWGRIRTGCSELFKAFKRLGKKIWNADFYAIAKGCYKVAEVCVKTAYKTAVWVVNHPTEIISLAWKGVKVVGQIALNFGKFALDEIENFCTDPVGTIKRFGSFLKAVSDHFGVTDLACGLLNLSLSAAYLLSGDLEKANKHFGETKRLIAGVLILAGEVTGITHFGRGIIALSKSQTGWAAFYFGMGGTQLYLFCTTLGIFNVLSKQGIEAMKEGVRILAKETGEEVVKELRSKISSELLEKVGGKIAAVAEQVVIKNWATVAKDLFIQVKGIAKETAERITEALLRKYGAKEIVTEATDKLLEKISEKSVRELAKELLEEGVKWRRAKFMARCMKKGLSKRGFKAGYHAMMADEIVDEITNQVKTDFMQRGLKAGFDNTWRGAAERIVSAHNLEEGSLELLLKAGHEGFDEGVETAIAKVVREGVEESFNKFRKKNKFPEFDNRGQKEDMQALEEQAKKNDSEAQAQKKKSRKGWFRWRKPDEEEVVRDVEGIAKVKTNDGNVDKKYLDL